MRDDGLGSSGGNEKRSGSGIFRRWKPKDWLKKWKWTWIARKENSNVTPWFTV